MPKKLEVTISVRGKGLARVWKPVWTFLSFWDVIGVALSDAFLNSLLTANKVRVLPWDFSRECRGPLRWMGYASQGFRIWGPGSFSVKWL